MQFPWYLKLLSYFFDIKLEECSSNVSKKLTVYLSRGRLKLCSEHAVYSEADHYYNFYEVFKKLDFKKKTFENTLVLGLGLGSIPWMLEKKFNLSSHYDIAELDNAVITLFNKFVKRDLNSPPNIFHTDAADFINTRADQFYKLICVDIFIDRKVPDQFMSNEFLWNLKKILHQQGMIIMNTLVENKEEINKDKLFESHFSQVFPNYTTMKILSNKMYIGMASNS